MPRILLLTNSKGYLSSKIKDFPELPYVDLEKIINMLSKRYEVTHIEFRELDFKRNYQGWYIIYGSSEERGLFYKSYIEDILLKLQDDGAILIPDFRWFRAHGNKSYQEILRKQILDAKIGVLHSEIIGRFSELKLEKYKNYPYVIKASSGAGSTGVRLARDEQELKKICRDLSYSRYIDAQYSELEDLRYVDAIWNSKEKLYHLIGKPHPYHNPKEWFHTNKIIIQEFIPNLECDYKVLYFSGKYYVLKRENRENDFRASGSGNFSFPKEVCDIEDVLNFAQKVASVIGMPMVSLDIARGKKCYLIEFQCLCFGPYTLQKSEWYFEYYEEKASWKKCMGKSDLEEEIARSYIAFIEQKESSFR